MMNDSSNSSRKESFRLVADDQGWFWIASFAIASITVIGNAIVILLIGFCARLRNRQNVFLLSLAVADLFIGLFVTPITFVCGEWVTCDQNIQATFNNFFLFSSTCNLLAMTLDRFVAVIYPLKYQRIMTNKMTVLLITLSWATAFIASFIRLTWHYTRPRDRGSIDLLYVIITDMLFGVIPCVGLSMVYCRIYMVVRKHRIQDCHQLTEVRYNHNDNNTNDRNINHYNNENNSVFIEVPQFPAARRNRSVGMKSVEFLGCVIGMFVVFYCLNVALSFCKNFNLCKVNEYTLAISLLLVQLNSAINFLVYSILKADFRRELLRVSRRLFRDR